MSSRELENIRQANAGGHLPRDGLLTRDFHIWLERATHGERMSLLHSCRAALEMAASLIDLEPGDEVIMPSLSFVSGANAIVLRGAVPMFVRMREDTLNLDESLIEAAINCAPA